MKLHAYAVPNLAFDNYVCSVKYSGEYYRAYRERKGLTMEDVEGSCGVSRAAISAIENNKVTFVRGSTKRALAKCYGVQPEDLDRMPPKFDGEQRPSREELLKGLKMLYLEGELTSEELDDELYLWRKERREAGLE